MKILASDLDQTLIYSYRQELGKDKVLAELYHGREVSFFTRRAYEELQRLYEQLLFVPVTTRSVEQYERIRFSEVWTPKAALAANGSVLLENGIRVPEWEEESRRLCEGSQEGLFRAEEILASDPYRSFEIRRVDGFFVFTKSEQPKQTMQRLKEGLQFLGTRVHHNGSKVYVLPEMLHKGTALQRLRKRYAPCEILASGDSLFDVEMMEEADAAVCPRELAGSLCRPTVVQAGEGERLSDVLLRTAEEWVRGGVVTVPAEL